MQVVPSSCNRQRWISGQLAESAVVLVITHKRATAPGCAWKGWYRCRRSGPTWRFGKFPFPAVAREMIGNPASPIPRHGVSTPFPGQPSREPFFQQPPACALPPSAAPKDRMRCSMLGSVLQRTPACTAAQASSRCSELWPAKPLQLFLLIMLHRSRDQAPAACPRCPAGPVQPLPPFSRRPPPARPRLLQPRRATAAGR